MNHNLSLSPIEFDLDDMPFEDSPPPLRIVELAAELEKALAEKRAARKTARKTRQVN
ncbi:hypothetical protein IFT84_06530 [Rhizobium sp. CFBP 8762]|uniref:hypothetical protein n=1 Tax=Rhizobium sp. CFBP 8762 TaxID=2775279 RepID=UPI0017804E3E|nr:hypothetical protein [Rhizobium sp. CFBP 8762]MBD8554179.1 hypothetical protein [Rhizobium sp. CFBP 8762]